ncbi:hypothetical protein Pla100_44620 [Neorhodopirellula pilleata]|uniref:Peptidase MA-like domain-containing protein n=2 Tax=Neorhodopirellula pilleata TaxID=2714738 RepID=A0A5C6A187_9BACT|nr:hypothetical protein Pla100_44620 [Neorhodopirellula pilleata]
MDALIAGWIRYGLVIASFWAISSTTEAANFRTRNFLIQAPNAALAKSVGEAAEKYRDDLATYWTGQTLPPWPTPCPVRVVAGPTLAAQGVTTYNPAPVRDFQMEVIGTPERILDSVLPHEVTHTVLATYFGRPLPRWADEGICTTVEHESERSKHEAKLREFLSSRRGIAMNQLFLLTEYPPDVLPMYAQGYSVCRFLIEQQGPKTFISFLKDYMQRPSWTANVQKHYGYDSLGELQEYWLSWVEAGSGPVAQFAKAKPQDSTPQNSTPRDEVLTSDTPVTSTPSQDDLNSLVAANDRGRVSELSTADSWYHRRAQGLASDQLEPAKRPDQAAPLASNDNAPLATNPPADRIATRDTTLGQVTPVSASQTLGNNDPNKSSSGVVWAPPSVLSSGRYSAATPQGETSGSYRGDVLAPGRRQLDSGRRSGSMSPGSMSQSMWR